MHLKYDYKRGYGMKMISKEIQNGKDVITTESKFLFWKRSYGRVGD